MLFHHLAELPNPGMSFCNGFGVIQLFAAELTIAFQTPFIQFPGRYGGLDRAARFRIMGTVVESAPLRQTFNVIKS